MNNLKRVDPDVYRAVQLEILRQNRGIELIASENFVSRAVLEAQGSVLTNKYAEGYPAKRWYKGCDNVDTAESLAIARARQLFGAEHANVQPHSGSQANMAVYFSVLKPGDTVLAMDLAHGGHLTHGNSLNFSGRFFKIVPYGVSRETEQIDYDQLRKLALEHRPRMIVAGASAYSRVIRFDLLSQIAREVSAYLFVDMAHIAGLVAAGLHPNPVPVADFVSTTTHKTLRGPRGGMVLCRADHAKALDQNVFPGIQGGPLMHVIAAKAVAFGEALRPEFREYQGRIVENAKAMARALEEAGLRIVSGGTDNHMMLVDLAAFGCTGKEASDWLDLAHITVNKNMIPFDTHSPFQAGGIRVGTPAVTTRGMGTAEMQQIAGWIAQVVRSRGREDVLEDVRGQVAGMCGRFPLYPDLEDRSALS